MPGHHMRTAEPGTFTVRPAPGPRPPAPDPPAGPRPTGFTRRTAAEDVRVCGAVRAPAGTGGRKPSVYPDARPQPCDRAARVPIGVGIIGSGSSGAVHGGLTGSAPAR
ncbi:hypothetical protein ACE1SV_23300 [Streptomyces sennicomposti]